MFKILSFNDTTVSIIPDRQESNRSLPKPTLFYDDDIKKGVMFLAVLCLLAGGMFGVSLTLLVRTFDV